MKQTRRIIRADGTEESLASPITTGEAARLIAAGPKGVDIVTLIQFGYPLWVMVVDGSGHEVEEIWRDDGVIELRSIGHTKPVNMKATELYRGRSAATPLRRHMIVGDVAILPDEDFPP